MEEVKKELRRTQSLVDYPRIFGSTITPSNVDYLNLYYFQNNLSVCRTKPENTSIFTSPGIYIYRSFQAFINLFYLFI